MKFLQEQIKFFTSLKTHYNQGLANGITILPGDAIFTQKGLLCTQGCPMQYFSIESTEDLLCNIRIWNGIESGDHPSCSSTIFKKLLFSEYSEVGFENEV